MGTLENSKWDVGSKTVPRRGSEGKSLILCRSGAGELGTVEIRTWECNTVTDICIAAFWETESFACNREHIGTG